MPHSESGQLPFPVFNGMEPLHFARQHCNKGEMECSWYHGNWYLLKSLGLVSTSQVHAETINELLKKAMSGLKSPRILITGSTDESLVRLTHNTCQALNIKEQLHALDICTTPLAFMESYAEKNNIQLITYQSNILEFEPKSHFDIILTHAFMGYFDENLRPLLMKKWQQLLSRHGKIVTVQRIRPIDSPKKVVFTQQQAQQFISTAIEAAGISAPNRQETDINIDIVKKAATEFTQKFSNYAITSKSDLESLFTNANLKFEFLEYHHLASKGDISGPSVPSNAEFAYIIANNSGLAS